MISTINIIDKLTHIDNKDMILTTTDYDTDRAIFELEIHNKTTKQGGIETFGFDEVIDALKQIKDDKVNVIDYNNSEYLIRIFVTTAEEIIGLFGLKKRQISLDERERIMRIANDKL